MSSRWSFGEVISGLAANGEELRSAVFNENEVRAAAGLTMVLGAVAFAYAYFAENYVPLQAVTALFFVEFLIRVTTGLRYSPMGLIARWMTQRQPVGVGFGQAQAIRLDDRPGHVVFDDGPHQYRLPPV